MASQVQITNMALAVIGQEPITAMSDNVRSARFANAAWDTLRDEILRAHPWNFAIKRVTLAENLLTYSEQFDNAAWTSTNSSETANSVHSPNGELIADTITDADGSNAGNTNQTVTIPDNDDSYQFSVYLKKGSASASAIQLEISGGSTTDTETATVTWGSSPTVDEGSIESIGDGWYRVTISITNNSTGNTSLIARIYPAGTTGSAQGTVFAWGAQVTQGTSAVQYAKTEATAIRPIIPHYEFDRGFNKPSDYIRLTVPENDTLPFRVEGAYVLTNEESIRFEYVYQCTDTALWDSQFTQIMVYRLAAHLAKPLTGDWGVAGSMMRMFSYYMNEAVHVDSKENQQPTQTIDGYTYLQARLTGVSEY